MHLSWLFLNKRVSILVLLRSFSHNTSNKFPYVNFIWKSKVPLQESQHQYFDTQKKPLELLTWVLCSSFGQWIISFYIVLWLGPYRIGYFKRWIFHGIPLEMQQTWCLRFQRFGRQCFDWSHACSSLGDLSNGNLRILEDNWRPFEFFWNAV